MTAKIEDETFTALAISKGFLPLEWYINSKTPILGLCLNCNRFVLKTIGGLRNTTQCCCKHCKGAASGASNRTSLFDIDKEYSSRGYPLLPGELERYKNNDTKLWCVCPNCSSPHPKSFCSLKQSEKGCTHCRSSLANQASIQICALKWKQVRDFFAAAGAILLSNAYQNAHEPLDYQCVCGKRSDTNQIRQIAYMNFRVGKRCVFCGIEKNSGENNPNWTGESEETIRKSSRIRRPLQSILRYLKNHPDIKHDVLGGRCVNELDTTYGFVNGTRNWHVDHKTPVSAFMEAGYGVKDKDKINHPSNLQVLSGPENMSKGKKCDPKRYQDVIFGTF